METITSIAKRKSVRSYRGEQLSQEILDAILAAGSAAPVGMRQYETMHLTVVQNKDVLGLLSGAVGQIMKAEGDLLYGAPTLVIISSKEQMAPGIDYCNAGCIAENMMLAATETGIGSVIIWASGPAAENIPDLRQALAIPEGFKPLFGVALGKAAEEDPTEKDLKIKIGVNRI